MKYFFILFTAAAILSCNNSDETAVNSPHINDSVARAALSDTVNYSRIEWIDSVHQDLGKINEGQVIDISWRLKNSGNKPLIIADVSPGCGCTVADKPKQPIPPGGESVIRASFDSKNQYAGEHQKGITVTANTTEQAYYLSFRVEVGSKK
jgi:hypothetical protein